LAEKESGMSIIYKICPASLWHEAERAGVFRGSEADLHDGFIHFSTADQVVETAAKHFAGEGDLLLISIESGQLGRALKWEISRGGVLFPHLYGALPLSAVTKIMPLPLGDDGRWLRYHPLFREFLQTRLREEHPEEIRPMLERMVKTYEQAGEWEKAYYTCKQLHAPEALANVIEHAGTAMLQSALITLEGWVNALPPSIVINSQISRPIKSVGQWRKFKLLDSGADFYHGLFSQLVYRDVPRSWSWRLSRLGSGAQPI
jgi:uncharacterized protein (DUF952 family)